jgi:hypothetical protein
MIPTITASTIYSTLGNNSSLIPLGIKDVANSCGLTTASYLAGDKLEGKDRFIDEFGTQAIWLGGLPTYKFLLGKILCAPKKLDSNVDVRILKDKDILKAAQEFAPTKEIAQSIKHVADNTKAFKGITMAKFIGATVLTALSYFGLTKFRHNYTEEQIKKEYLAKKAQMQKVEEYEDSQIPFSSSFSNIHNIKKDKNVSFTGLQSFMFDPVRNLMLVDGVITGERFTHARNKQDFMGYAIKEGSFWLFMYYAGQKISKMLEQHAEKKYNKSIDLDARVIESEKLKEVFSNGTLKTHIEEFIKADISDVDIYKFAVNPKTDNIVIDMAKKSDIVPLLKLSWFKKSDKVDTRQYISLEDLRGCKDKLQKLYNQYEKSGENIEDFFKQVRKLKRASVLKNIGACIGALGVIAPCIMLMLRKFGADSEYQVKKDVEAKLEQNA